jgi:hypothetical protein
MWNYVMTNNGLDGLANKHDQLELDPTCTSTRLQFELTFATVGYDISYRFLFLRLIRGLWSVVCCTWSKGVNHDA